ncbi:HNH endonuclease [Virgibacillus salexigens]|uniref:HNH endonuclease n=2 Tax=Virgibacillus TaxID=84406 RepID=UPI001F48355C|nr:HNH endonuclease [Virgibacillus salexigens]
MDVKYIPSDWEKMRSGLGDLVGLGRWGKGMIDELKDITENMEDAASDIAEYDSDGVISFSHIDRESTYQKLYEDFQVMHDFTGKVGDIVDRTMDQPFYEDIDAFVSAMKEATISNYTTKNRIGATEEQITYHGYGAMHTTREVPKTEVSLDDLFSGDTFYGEQMQIEYEMWKAEHPDQDFTQEEYQMAAVNMNAFEYESIKDQQLNKEFWVNIGALVVVVGVAVVCPPAGLALGAAYGSLELGSAISGKDWSSGRELDTGERWMRGALAPLDIIPGVAGVKKFATTTRTVGKVADLGRITKQPSNVRNLVSTAKETATARLTSARQVVNNKMSLVKENVSGTVVNAAQKADDVATHLRAGMQPNVAIAGGGRLDDAAVTYFSAKAKDAGFVKSSVTESSSGAGKHLDDGKDLAKGTMGNNRQIDFTRGFDVDPKYSSYEQRVKTTPVNKGEWSNERAESLFISDKTGEIKKYLDEAGVDGVEYKNGMPDFSPFSKGEIKLANMTNDRKSNFSTADEELAKKWSTPEQKWTAEDIADWREDNKYTWHELNDLETIQLVPSKINSVFKHLGGVGEYNIKVKLGE